MSAPETELGLAARAMYDALMRARPHVEDAEQWNRALLLEGDAQDAADVLEAIDGALADAGELVALSGLLTGGDRGGAA